MILVLRALGVGDLATAVPALRGLRAAFPGHTLSIAAPDWLTPLAELIGDVDNVIPANGLDPVDWAGPAPYWAVNLHGRGPQSHRLLGSADPERLCAFQCSEAGHLDGPQWRQDEHEVHRWCRMLTWYGVPADPDDLDLRRPAPRRVPVGVSVLHPGGKGTARRWSPGRFASLARELARTGHRVVVTGSPDERDLAERIVAGAGLPNTAVLAGRLDLVEMAAVVGHARLVVSTDTGIAHLATAYRVPSVVLFGPVRPEFWGPPPDRPWHRALHASVTPARSAPASVIAGADPARAGMHPAVSAGPASVVAGADLAGMHPSLAAIEVDEVLTVVGEVERAGRSCGAATT
ncbi:glycosyltransferase family 9 protein [Plantactinospora sp. S1510]|uniref:Glycosyltransferase family 9 protein n=1 Tax=Plantactinospora alkalitolerans TaxID=2789879 RepID=A0ABS0GS85_9ACTN|nr:glycosyltransferase family 9 protein [Plantactinospora alkalitolerans]MBF9129052.1 glycosyltransferase family 9 protein [Plantactinospora alkalitolerans]